MKYAKILGLLVVAAAAMAAFAASASATQVTVNGVVATPEIVATNEGTLTLHGVADINCDHSIVKGTVTTHGPTETASGPISTLHFSECDQHVTVIKNGSLEIHTDPADPAGTSGNGTLTASGFEVTVQVTTIFGTVHCIFAGNEVDIGTLTGATASKPHATLDIDADIPAVKTNPLCGSEAEWTGQYLVTSPTNLKIH